MLVVSWIALVVCCLGYGVGSVLQSVGAKRAAAAGGVRGIAMIAVQAPYLLGLGADGVAFIGNAIAARELPLFLVQAVMAGSIGVTALLAAWRGTRFAGRDWAALGLLGAGLVLLAISARESPPASTPAATGWVILACCLLPLAVGGLGMKARGRAAWVLPALGSGLGFAVVGLAARGLGAEPLGWALVTRPLLWALVLGGVLAMGFFAIALQRGPVTAVTAISFMVELIVPSAVGMLIFGDGVNPGMVPAAAAGFVLAVVGSGALVRRAE